MSPQLSKGARNRRNKRARKEAEILGPANMPPKLSKGARKRLKKRALKQETQRSLKQEAKDEILVPTNMPPKLISEREAKDEILAANMPKWISSTSKGPPKRVPKKNARNEIHITTRMSMPKGYVFIPRGDSYMTLLCRKLTHEARKPLYVIDAQRDGRKRPCHLGIRVPVSILSEVKDRAAKKEAKYQETSVSPKQPMPEGYVFLPKGDRYMTLHCRKLTHEAEEPLFVVHDDKTKPKKLLGIRIPKFIFQEVKDRASKTLASRRAATDKRDTLFADQATEALQEEFPEIPEEDLEQILKHGFRKYSGRVGRNGQLPMSKKVVLAVIAHMRHRYTKYDKLLNDGMDRVQGRRVVTKIIQDMLFEWGSKDRYSWYFRDPEFVEESSESEEEN